MIQNIFWRWCGFRRFLSPWQETPHDPQRSFFLWQNIFVQQDIWIFLWQKYQYLSGIFQKMMRVEEFSLSLTGDLPLILRGVFMAKYICSARYMYISVERYQYFSGIFSEDDAGSRGFSLLDRRSPPDPQRSFTTDGDSNYKETRGCHSSSSCLFLYRTNFTIITTNLPFVLTNSWLCDDNFDINLYRLVRFLIISSLFWTNISTNVYVYHTCIPVLAPKYLHCQKYTFLWHKLFVWHKI